MSVLLFNGTSSKTGPKPCERGSALLLVPATFLIIMMLALFALNSALSFLATQELERRASAAANDAVSGLARDGYFVGGSYVVDASGARILGTNSAQARLHDTHHPDNTIVITRVGATTVRATAYGRGAHITSSLLPWSSPQLHVTVEAEAEDQ